MLYWMERMEFGYDNLKQDYAPYLKLRPSEYVRRNCYLTVESNEACLPEAIKEIGAGHLMASSDYPHWDSGWPGCISELEKRSDIPSSAKERILSRNIADLLKIDAN
jgi:predicted TIM-barrel fold metal-dependent hydrolase